MTAEPGAESPAAMPLLKLQEKVGKGITWLTEHDPTGAFYLWFQSGILPDAMPAQSAEVKEAYRAYRSAMAYWKSLEQLLDKREREAAHGSSSTA